MSNTIEDKRIKDWFNNHPKGEANKIDLTHPMVCHDFFISNIQQKPFSKKTRNDINIFYIYRYSLFSILSSTVCLSAFINPDFVFHAVQGLSIARTAMKAQEMAFNEKYGAFDFMKLSIDPIMLYLYPNSTPEAMAFSALYYSLTALYMAMSTTNQLDKDNGNPPRFTFIDEIDTNIEKIQNKICEKGSSAANDIYDKISNLPSSIVSFSKKCYERVFQVSESQRQM